MIALWSRVNGSGCMNHIIFSAITSCYRRINIIDMQLIAVRDPNNFIFGCKFIRT